jgi:lipoyl(octanoyl) transferase
MSLDAATLGEPAAASATLQAYLLGEVDFEAVLGLQRRLVYQVAGEPDGAAIILCEHPPLVTVGRQGSVAHLLFDEAELRARRWRVRWVNRGGGCILHLPGQLAVYPILALDRRRLGIRAYLSRLHDTLADTLADFGILGQRRPDQAGLWVGSHMIAQVGVAVLDWVCYYGAVLNVQADLQPFRWLKSDGCHEGRVTSIARERRGPLRPALVRQRLLEHFARRFDFAETAIFFDHPSLPRKASSHAVATRS